MNITIESVERQRDGSVIVLAVPAGRILGLKPNPTVVTFPPEQVQALARAIGVELAYMFQPKQIRDGHRP